jgi:hypothetical protein
MRGRAAAGEIMHGPARRLRGEAWWQNEFCICPMKHINELQRRSIDWPDASERP